MLCVLVFGERYLCQQFPLVDEIQSTVFLVYSNSKILRREMCTVPLINVNVRTLISLISSSDSVMLGQGRFQLMQETQRELLISIKPACKSVLACFGKSKSMQTANASQSESLSHLNNVVIGSIGSAICYCCILKKSGQGNSFSAIGI